MNSAPNRLKQHNVSDFPKPLKHPACAVLHGIFLLDL
jgi:hypothetical protein